MVVEINKSFDLLLGILVFIGWYHLHSEKGNDTIKMSLVLLMQMATSMIYDMRKVTNSLPHQTLISQLQRLPQFGKKPPSTTNSMDEKRAFLGCFYLTSVTTHYLGKGQTLHWDSTLQECLEELEKCPEWYGDDVLAHQVRTQLVIERATMLSRYESALEPTEHPRALSSLHIQALKAELSSIKSRVKERISNDREYFAMKLADSFDCSFDAALILLHHYGIELAIVEISLVTSKTGNTNRSLLQESFRFECLRSIKCWFDVYFSIPATELQGLSFYIVSQVILSLGTLYFITAEAGARREEIRAEIDALATIDRLIQLFQEAISTPGISNDDVQNRMLYVYRTIRSVWAVELGDTSTGSAQRTVMAPTPPSMDDAPLAELFNMELFENGFDWNLAGEGSVMGAVG
ncbi:Hypothetical protein R9X50_00192900 [Acrodontium crateriforme]|uniref:Transcription factor domain-containing protein n=1 Tax=Acrodontium crateriforme TaxID=150365 RepID=A0AAQ3M004_9PEZI|nr:Hypothetical protein R9X50_00192900 [Acrodontium crateriforme]